jgi:phage terminase large subunit GpA-like protein
VVVDGVKSEIMARLTGHTVSIHFSDTLEPRFHEEITSEQLVVKYSRGAPARQWERIVGRRAESLDCVVYGWAVRSLLGGLKQSGPNSPSPTPSCVAIKSDWPNRSI